MSTGTLTDVLNQVSAIVNSGASTWPILSQETGISPQKIYELVKLRRNDPNGPKTAALMKWAGERLVEISQADEKTQRAYRREFRKISAKFPATGERKD